MRRTIVEQIMVPELPNVLAKEQYMLYAPIANSDYPGMVKLGNMADPNYLLTLDDGVLTVKSKVNITAVHLNTTLTSDDLGKITFTRGDGTQMTATGSLSAFIRNADDANKNIIRGIEINNSEDSSALGSVTFTKNGADPIIVENAFRSVFNSIVKNVSIDRRINITEENKADDEELGSNPNLGNVTFERWGNDDTITIRNVFADVFRDRITGVTLINDDPEDEDFGKLRISKAVGEIITDKVLPIYGRDYFTESDVNSIVNRVQFLSEYPYKQGGYGDPEDEESFVPNGSASIAGASLQLAENSMAVGPYAQTFSSGAVAFGNSAEAHGTDSMAVGNGAKTYTQGSVAFGKNARAGSRAYYIVAIKRANGGRPDGNGVYSGAIVLSTEPQEDRFTNVEYVERFWDSTFRSGYAVGDEFCVINNTHYSFCGRITQVSGNVIDYETILTGRNYSDVAVNVILPNDNFAIANAGGKRDNWRDCILWVPSKPEAGVLISNEEDQLFNTAYSFGDNSFAVADDAFASGDDVYAAGNHGVVFGVRNKGAYANLIGMRENISTGVHSTLLGRGLRNFGSYNALFNEKSVCYGNGNIIGGNENVAYGNYNIISGNKNKIYSNYNGVVGGNNILVVSGNTTGYACVAGINNLITIENDPGVGNRIGTNFEKVTYPENLDMLASNSANDCCAIFGNSNLARHKQCLLSGRHLITGRKCQTVLGISNVIDESAALVIGNGAEGGAKVQNCFTVGSSGTRSDVDTDGVTVMYLNSTLNNSLLTGRW